MEYGNDRLLGIDWRVVRVGRGHSDREKRPESNDLVEHAGGGVDTMSYLDAAPLTCAHSRERVDTRQTLPTLYLPDARFGAHD